MFRNPRVPGGVLPSFGLLAIALVSSAPAQEQPRRARIEVQDYAIDAEISPTAQSLTAKAVVRFTALDDNVGGASFELNNALTVSKVEDAAGKPIEMTRNQQDFSVRLTFQPDDAHHSATPGSGLGRRSPYPEASRIPTDTVVARRVDSVSPRLNSSA